MADAFGIGLACRSSSASRKPKRMNSWPHFGVANGANLRLGICRVAATIPLTRLFVAIVLKARARACILVYLISEDFLLSPFGVWMHRTQGRSFSHCLCMAARQFGMATVLIDGALRRGLCQRAGRCARACTWSGSSVCRTALPAHHAFPGTGAVSDAPCPLR